MHCVMLYAMLYVMLCVFLYVMQRGNVALLRRALRRDGLSPGGSDTEEFRLAQFDALNSLNTRRSEVWVELEDHPWVNLD